MFLRPGSPSGIVAIAGDELRWGEAAAGEASEAAASAPGTIRLGALPGMAGAIALGVIIPRRS